MICVNNEGINLSEAQLLKSKFHCVQCHLFPDNYIQDCNTKKMATLQDIYEAIAYQIRPLGLSMSVLSTQISSRFLGYSKMTVFYITFH